MSRKLPPISCCDCGVIVRPQLKTTTRCALCSRRRVAALYLKPANDARIANRTRYECRVCGRVGYCAPSIRRVTCSWACRSEWQSIRQRGEKSHLWQGGKTAKILIKRMSLEYSHWRTDVFRRDEYTCQMCNEKGGKLSAHHILEVQDRPDLLYSSSNGITLCWPCHTSIRHKEADYVRRFRRIVNQNFARRQLELVAS